MERRLAAILAADVVGYSRLMGSDEEGVLAALKSLRSELFDPLVEAHHGRIVKLMGDGALVEFASIVDAVTCAAAVQRKLAQRNESLPEDARLQLRIGVNLGDVIIEGEDIYGDGVNVAARLEGEADPGGICVSEAVMAQTNGKVPLGFEYLGERRLKNIEAPVKLYRIDLEGRAAASRPAARRRPILAAAALALIIAGAYAAWDFGLFSGAEDDMAFTEAMVLTEPPGPTIAVMPFDNLSNDQEQAYLAAGMTEDVIVELGRYRDLNVLSRQSTMAIAEMAMDVRKIGAELDADYVLEGAVRMAGERLRVTARLIDAKSGQQVWSEAFNEGLTASEILDVQLGITERVASAVGDAGGAIKRIHAREARAKPPENLSSYECSIHKVGFFDRSDLQERVRGCILRVIEEEPKYWRGWAQLAEALKTDVMLFTGLYEGTHAEKLEQAASAARKAISLNSDSAWAQYELSMVLLLQGDREGYYAASERALALGGDRYLEGEIGYYFVWTGRHEFGAKLLRRAIALDPSAAEGGWHLALAEHHFFAGEYEDALAEYKKGAQPQYWWSVMLEAAYLSSLGREAEARAAMNRLYAMRPEIKIADIVWLFRRFQRPDRLSAKYVEEFRKLDMPEGRYRPLDLDETG